MRVRVSSLEQDPQGRSGPCGLPAQINEVCADSSEAVEAGRAAGGGGWAAAASPLTARAQTPRRWGQSPGLQGAEAGDGEGEGKARGQEGSSPSSPLSLISSLVQPW